jgi:sugar phosphate permease
MLTWVTTRQKSRDHTGAREVLMQLPKKLTASGNVLVLLSLMYFITYVDRVNISTAAPAIKGEFGLNNTELGLIFSAFAYPYALFQVFGGWLGDKWGARLTLFLCGTIWAAATILTGLASGLVSLFGIASCSALARAQLSRPRRGQCRIGSRATGAVLLKASCIRRPGSATR